jgi:TRAP-type mannitol/chloroaromatic compound transport system permease small subunit
VSALLGLSRLIDWLNEHIGKTVAWAILVAVLVSAGNAIIRKVFGTSSNAWLELQWYLFGAVFMLCAAWTLKENEHIRIDIVAGRLSKRARDWIEIVGHVFFLFPFVAVMIWLTWPFFWRSYLSGEVSTNAGGLIIWPAKLLVLVGFVVLALQWASELIKRIAVMRGELEDPYSSAMSDAERTLAEMAAPPPPPPGGDPR